MTRRLSLVDSALCLNKIPSAVNVMDFCTCVNRGSVYTRRYAGSRQ